MMYSVKKGFVKLVESIACDDVFDVAPRITLHGEEIDAPWNDSMAFRVLDWLSAVVSKDLKKLSTDLCVVRGFPALEVSAVVEFRFSANPVGLPDLCSVGSTLSHRGLGVEYSQWASSLELPSCLLHGHSMSYENTKTYQELNSDLAPAFSELAKLRMESRKLAYASGLSTLADAGQLFKRVGAKFEKVQPFHLLGS